MRRSNQLALLIACSIVQWFANASLAEETFHPMFNGVDFDGWVRTNTPTETWSYQDGMVICSGRPIGEIRTEKMYQNFIMELEWRHMVPRGNAGIFVWADDITARGVPFHRGIEVQVLENAYGNNQSHTTHGDIFPIHGATMTPINGRGGRRAFPTESRSKPSPEWNHYRIECRNGDISLAVNGKVVTRGTECVPSKGYICLESEGGIVHYRNVRIMELPDTEVTSEKTAISDRGYESIYRGLDLNGWKDPSESPAWKSRDWILGHDAEAGQTHRLESENTLKPSRFVIDVRLKDDSSTAVVHVGGVAVDLSAAKTWLEKTGRWNRIEGIKSDGRVLIQINGKDAMTVDETLAGKFVLEANGPVEFSNLYVAPRSE
ncbi:MAG: DUF1080 domain-containing protein [Planctomycetota bacterium]